MKHVVVALATIAAVAAAAAGAAATGAADGPFEQARTWATPLGEVYGPVQAGPETSASYGFVAK